MPRSSTTGASDGSDLLSRALLLNLFPTSTGGMPAKKKSSISNEVDVVVSFQSDQSLGFGCEKEERGWCVANVCPGQQAEKGGVKVGDMLYRFGADPYEVLWAETQQDLDELFKGEFDTSAEVEVVFRRTVTASESSASAAAISDEEPRRCVSDTTKRGTVNTSEPSQSGLPTAGKDNAEPSEVILVLTHGKPRGFDVRKDGDEWVVSSIGKGQQAEEAGVQIGDKLDWFGSDPAVWAEDKEELDDLIESQFKQSKEVKVTFRRVIGSEAEASPAGSVDSHYSEGEDKSNSSPTNNTTNEPSDRPACNTIDTNDSQDNGHDPSNKTGVSAEAEKAMPPSDRLSGNDSDEDCVGYAGSGGSILSNSSSNRSSSGSKVAEGRTAGSQRAHAFKTDPVFLQNDRIDNSLGNDQLKTGSHHPPRSTPMTGSKMPLSSRKPSSAPPRLAQSVVSARQQRRSSYLQVQSYSPPPSQCQQRYQHHPSPTMMSAWYYPYGPPPPTYHRPSPGDGHYPHTSQRAGSNVPLCSPIDTSQVTAAAPAKAPVMAPTRLIEKLPMQTSSVLETLPTPASSAKKYKSQSFKDLSEKLQQEDHPALPEAQRVAQMAALDAMEKVQQEEEPAKRPRTKVSSMPWTADEDSKLIELVRKYGPRPKKWALIASQMQGPRRGKGKQCRDRYLNHLDPSISKEPWTSEEDRIILESHLTFGSKWAKIATLLPGRTDNAIKNRWNSSMNKGIEKYLEGKQGVAKEMKQTKEGHLYAKGDIGGILEALHRNAHYSTGLKSRSTNTKKRPIESTIVAKKAATARKPSVTSASDLSSSRKGPIGHVPSQPRSPSSTTATSPSSSSLVARLRGHIYYDGRGQQVCEGEWNEVGKDSTSSFPFYLCRDLGYGKKMFPSEQVVFNGYFRTYTEDPGVSVDIKESCSISFVNDGKILNISGHGGNEVGAFSLTGTVSTLLKDKFEIEMTKAYTNTRSHRSPIGKLNARDAAQEEPQPPAPFPPDIGVNYRYKYIPQSRLQNGMKLLFLFSSGWELGTLEEKDSGSIGVWKVKFPTNDRHDRPSWYLDLNMYANSYLEEHIFDKLLNGEPRSKGDVPVGSWCIVTAVQKKSRPRGRKRDAPRIHHKCEGYEDEDDSMLFGPV